MRFDYLYDESDKTLAPFFSGLIVTYTFRCLILTGIILLIMWPRLPFYHYLETSVAPFLFFQVFAVATIFSSYLSLRCGKGELIEREYVSEYQKEIPCFEKERNFFAYGLVGFLLHTGFLTLPFIPLLVVSATVSWVPFAHFTQGVIVLYASALLCRVAGFTLYLLGGSLSYFGYFISRMFIIFHLFATALFYSRINPLYVLYKLNKGMNSGDSPENPPFCFYVLASGLALCMLSFVCHFLILRFTRSERRHEPGTHI